MKSPKELFLIISLALLARIPCMTLIPHIEAPDENNHLWVANFIANHLCLPDLHSIYLAGYEAVYAPIPQLGYLPHIFFLKCFSSFFSPDKYLYLARLGSLFMGLIVITVSHKLGRLLFPANRIAALALPLLICFHPQFVFICSYVNTDATTAALASLILLLLCKASKTGLNILNAAGLTITCSWLILSKYSGYCVILTAAVSLLLIVYKNKEKYRIQIALLAAMGIGTVLLTGWWFLRNYFAFNGDITGVKTMYTIWTSTYHRYVEKFASPFAILISTRFWRMLFFSFWGWFGYMTRSLPRAIYYGYLGFFIASILSFFRRKNYQINLIWFIILFCFITNISMCIYGTYSGVAGPQGRYLFPSEIPIISMLVAGLNYWGNRWSKYLTISFIIFNAAAYLYSYLYLLKLYG